MRFTVSGLAAMRKDIERTKKRLDRSDLNDAAALRFFDVVSAKFDAEGPGWAPLSKYRLERRKSKPEPILDYKGDLRRAATSWVDDHKGPKIDMRVSGTTSTKTWTLSGEKVDNQWGGVRNIVLPRGPVVRLTEPITRSINLPARPFWPMDAEWEPTIDKMMEPIERFADNWASGDFGPFDADLKKSKSRKRTR